MNLQLKSTIKPIAGENKDVLGEVIAWDVSGNGAICQLDNGFNGLILFSNIKRSRRDKNAGDKPVALKRQSPPKAPVLDADGNLVAPTPEPDLPQGPVKYKYVIKGLGRDATDPREFDTAEEAEAAGAAHVLKIRELLPTAAPTVSLITVTQIITQISYHGQVVDCNAETALNTIVEIMAPVKHILDGELTVRFAKEHKKTILDQVVVKLGEPFRNIIKSLLK